MTLREEHARTSHSLHHQLHGEWLAEESWSGHAKEKWILRIASAATLGNREKDEQHGFNEIVITREGEEMFLSVQRFVRKDSQNWVADGVRFEEFKPGLRG